MAATRKKSSSAAPKITKKTVKQPKAAKSVATKKTAASPAKKAASPAKRRRTLLDAAKLKLAIDKIAKQIHKEFPTPDGLAIMGIRTGGEFIAGRIHSILEKKYKAPVGLGILDITFYRDDLSRLGPDPKVKGSEFPFDINDANVVLVDDVLFTGRTVRAAMDELTDFGRPSVIRLAVLLDRGLRECPIAADYCALQIKSKPEDAIRLELEETHDADRLFVEKGG